ncbi:DNA polymerase II [Vibrio mangrovi]|uniref:DNA polymerase n=1 Tax=Vibrio mangrovi TaxID=474394 RepID=A0A1Y6IP06_9VIBR|nr:DNA polymerase II [Vibrio mangrovi]MDW6003818.1 DNA polymerase II [Vibrio mangrovi]SMR99387.1 DNA polymerase II [Vibrio mangrovi]
MTLRKGFLLTRHARDINGTTQIELWASTPEGPTQILIHHEKPVCFIPTAKTKYMTRKFSQMEMSVDLKPLPLKSFFHEPLTACYCQTLQESKHIHEVCHQEDVEVLEGDIKLAERYLMERFIRGSFEFTGHMTTQGNVTIVQDAKCRRGEYLPTLKVVSLDLECSEKGELYSVGLDSNMDSRVIMVGSPQQTDNEHAPVIQWVENERALLLALVSWFHTYDPDIIIGWNVIDFDFRLLHRRADKHQLRLMLGRNSQSSYFRTSSQSQQGFVTIPGRVVLNGIDTLKTATYQFPSWSLESVSQTLLNEGKAIHQVHDRMDEINAMFHHDKVRLAIYNLKDCQLVNRIFAHTHLLDFVIQRARLTGIELDRLGGSVASFTNLYLPQLHRAGYVAPNLSSAHWQASPGGYVMDSIPNLYDSVLVLDFKSLYPSIIRSFLIDPLGLIEGLKQEVGPEAHQAVPGFRGGQFHRTKHFLPQMIETLWAARDEAKKNNEKAFSQAIKIIMNSFYGVLGSAGCRFFDTRLASSITMRGHEIMKQTRTLIEEQGYQVIYGDTDSTFVSLGKSYQADEADHIGRQLVAQINQWWDNHLRETYHLNSFLEIEYETHYTKFFMPTIRGADTGSKKRYAGLIQTSDGEQLIFKGLESARTDWTTLAQRFQQQLYLRIFHGENPCDYIREFVEATLDGQYDQELIYRKRLRRKLHEYQKNIPPQVRAARMADEINQKRGKPLQYQNKGTIEYVITLNGPEPVAYQASKLDYQHYIDKQLRPIADAILPFIGYQFDDLTKPQLGLF